MKECTLLDWRTNIYHQGRILPKYQTCKRGRHRANEERKEEQFSFYIKEKVMESGRESGRVGEKNQMKSVTDAVSSFTLSLSLLSLSLPSPLFWFCSTLLMFIY